MTDKERMEKEAWELPMETMERGRSKNADKNGQVPTDEGSKASGKAKTGTAANSRYVRVRKVPAANSQVVAVMNAGEKAEILDRIPGFYKVRTVKGGHVGFVASNYFMED